MQRVARTALICLIGFACRGYADLADNGDSSKEKSLAAAGCEFRPDVHYGTRSNAQTLDILYPSEHRMAAPAVLYIHGGGWGGGDKSDDPEMMMGMLNGIAADGFVALSINYRLCKEAPFPAAVEDCKLAIRWLRAHAEEFGVDPKRIGVVGGSAGGHLAAMLAVTGDINDFDGSGGYPKESSAVQAAVSVSGPTDLTVNMCATQVESRYKMVSDFLGVPLKDNMALARRASPITYVRKDAPPTLFVHCKDDKAIDADQSIRMADAMKKAGAPAQLLLLDGTNHGSDMARTEPVLSDLRKFFRDTLKPTAPKK